ncbi:MAG: Gfo/Idh/MocA family oxidoreductase [Clostridiaceae bacterium]|nr:Gfo/Idh/MocA family oxidoreductase [Clostridiaceae bacterium]
MDKIKVGIIGAGNISNCHMAGYQALDSVEVIAVCDINAQRAADYARKYNIPHVYTDYHEMVRLPELDAVSVCTWNNGHKPAAVAALKAGKHVLCEKPPALNTAEALEMQQAARESGKLLMIGFVRRFGKNTRIMSDFIRDGALGRIYYAKTSCVRRVGNPGGWFADKKRSGGGPLIDLGVHMIDLVRFLIGKPQAVTVTGATFADIGPRYDIKMLNRYQPADPSDFCDVEDMAVAMIRFDNGVVLQVETSFCQNIKDEKLTLELYGTKAGAIMEPKMEIFSTAGGYLMDMTPRYSEDENPFAENFKNETAHFIDCIQNGTTCLNPVEDGVELMKILDAVYASASSGHEVVIR